MKEDVLQSLGLTDKEVKVYLALLRLGSSSVQKIASVAQTYRTYTYELLNSLMRKGFISNSIRSGKRYYECIPPSTIVDLLKEKQKKVESILPELNDLYKSIINKPKIEIYEKKEGLKTLISKVINEVDNSYVGIGNHKSFLKYFSFFTDVLITKRIKKGITTKYVFENSSEAKSLLKSNKEQLRKTKNVSFLKNVNAELWTYKDVVVFFTFVKKEPLGIEIKNKEMANLLKKLFDFIWEKV